MHGSTDTNRSSLCHPGVSSHILDTLASLVAVCSSTSISDGRTLTPVIAYERTGTIYLELS